MPTMGAAFCGRHSLCMTRDLLINGQYAFECRGNIPGATYEGEFVDAKWDGHAWVILAGVLCDLSIFRVSPALYPVSVRNRRRSPRSGAGFKASNTTRKSCTGDEHAPCLDERPARSGARRLSHQQSSRLQPETLGSAITLHRLRGSTH